jgi:hypothetical protein
MLYDICMPELTYPSPGRAPPSRGVSSTDVERAADRLLRAGDRPTIEKIRAVLKGGSPNTINPLLDAWWRRLSARLDSGPAALHRLPESVAHVAEALWMQALDEGRRRAQLELKSSERDAAEQQQALQVRSHVLSLREGELDSRLRDRESAIAALNRQLRELTRLLRNEQATREAQSRRIAALEAELLVRRQPRKNPPRARAPQRRTLSARRAGQLSISKTSIAKGKAQTKRRPPKRRVSKRARTVESATARERRQT